jgi:hypothetical protein
MKKLSTLTLTGVGTNALLERNKLELGKGRLMKGVRLIMRVLLANASGGSVTLTDTQRQDFLNGYRLTLSYGRNNRRKPYNAMRLPRLQRIARYMLGSEWEGYGNTTTGLGRALANGATHEVKLHVVVPTGYFWQLGQHGKFLGVGRTQARTMQLFIERTADTLPAGLTVSGAVTFEVVPDEVVRPVPDTWWYLPEWVEQDETDKVAKVQAGLPLYLAERSATLTASLITDMAMRFDEDVDELHRGVSALEAYSQAIYDLPNVPADADLADRETPLYYVPPGTELRELVAGRLRFEQVTKTLSTAALGLLYVPVPGDAELREDVQDAAGKNGRNKTLKAVSAAAALGLEIPEHLYPFLPFYLYDQDDKEFERFPGLLSDGSGPADVFLPQSVLARARAALDQYSLTGEAKQAEDTVRAVALAVPGAVQDTRGFSRRGSDILNQVRVTLAG